MSCDRRPHRDRCSLGVTGLTDHDNIRILTEQCTQSHFKRQSGCIVYLCLVDFFNIFLYRIFDRGYIDTALCHLIQNHIQGGCLTTSGRSGQINNTVRTVEHRTKSLIIAFFHTKRIRMLDRRIAGEQTEYRLFSKDSRQDGYTDIDIFSFYVDAEMSILRYTPFRNIQFGYDFDTCDQ